MVADNDLNDEFRLLKLRAQGRYEEVLEIYRRDLILEPQNAALRAQYGVTLSQSGKPVEGIAEVRQAVALSPEYGFRQILVELLIEQQVWPDAMSESNILIEMEPQLSTSYVLLGEAYRGSGELAKAISSYEHAQTLAAWNTNMMLRLGELYTEAMRFDDAVKILTLVIAKAPKLRIARLRLGFVLAKQGHIVVARRHWESVLSSLDELEEGKLETFDADIANQARRLLELYKE